MDVPKCTFAAHGAYTCDVRGQSAGAIAAPITQAGRNVESFSSLPFSMWNPSHSS
jgi:hypothetical protein